MSGRAEARERRDAERGYRVYGYRWVVLGVVMVVNFMIQVLWISYGAIIADASDYYGVSHQLVTLLSMVFMIAFIPLSLPAAWVIDSRGFRTAVGFGVVMMGVFGVLRGLAGSNYSLVLVCTIGIAVAQPFLLNAWTKVPANWFAPGERATAVGLITLASMLGVGAGLALSSVLIGVMSIGAMQLVYGAAGGRRAPSPSSARARAAGDLARARRRGGPRAHARRPQARADRQAVPRHPGGGVRDPGRLQRRQQLDRRHRPPAGVRRRRRRPAGHGDARGRRHRRRRPLGDVGSPGQARPLSRAHAGAGDPQPGRGGLRLFHACCSTRASPRSASSSSAPCRSACSTPRR